MKPLTEYSFREFKQLILYAAKSADPWYFSQTREGYYADYRPDYPNNTAADFTVYLCNGCDKPRLTIYQETATIPTVKQYSDMMDLLRDISKMEAKA